MKDQDLEDIGRRLYDLEADPPKNGWDTLGAAIRTGRPSAKIMWIQRNWWKTVVIIIPVLFYFWIDEKSIDTSHTSASLEKIANENSQESSVVADTSGNQTNVSTRNSNSLTTTNSIKQSSVEVEPAPVEYKAIYREAKVAVLKSLVNTNDDSISGTPPSSFNENDTNAVKNDETTTVASSISPFIESRESSPDRLISVTEVVGDSLVKEDKEEKSIIGQTHGVSKEEEENKEINPWRISLAAMPQFISRSVSPNQNDEVFVTDVKDESEGFANLSGYSFSLGINRAISPQWQLDGQLSFSRSKQDVRFSYTNGNVDTLLAVVQADQSVRLVPVYEQRQQHTMNKYSFVGLRLGVTHFFWAKNKTRFNFSASLGANYLISASVMERAESDWQNLPGNGLQKVHYNLAVAAGYNHNFAPGWELMVSPALLYNIGQLKNDQLPYRMTQRTFGLNVMVSKVLGK